jgi:TolA-binding protein
MPVNLISAAFAWLATHLVILSLLGFLFAGLFVFGLINGTGPGSVQQKKTFPAPTQSRPDALPATGTASSSPIGGADQSVAEKAESAGNLDTAPVDAGRGLVKGEAGRLPPRLIGGSLPIYGQQDAPQSQPGAMPGAIGNGFRPPTEDPGPAAGGMTREDYVQQARRAFWNGEFEAAEAAYMALISQYPADADAFGELGNLYQSMGKPQRAMDAYFEAAVRLKAAGNTDKLKEVMELLTREGDPRADQLRP